MQMFFLKNLVGVSIAALILGGISIATIAEQEETPIDQSQNPQGGMVSAPDAAEGQGDLPSQSVPDKNYGFIPPEEQLYEEMIDKEANPMLPPEEMPLPPEEEPIIDNEGQSQVHQPHTQEPGSQSQMVASEQTPLERAEERLKALNDLDEPAEPRLPEPDALPVPPQDNDIPSINGDQLDQSVPTLEPSLPLNNEEGMATPELILPAPESIAQEQEPTMIKPDLPIEQPNDNSSQMTGEGVTPSASKGQKIRAQSKYIMVSQSNDDQMSTPMPKKDDNSKEDTSPTRLPGSKHGHDKGMKIVNPKMIPIIRMGEYLSQQENGSSKESGFTIIKSWNN